MSENQQNFTGTGLEIAVIGMAGRFPNASNLEIFWDNLQNGQECISFFCDEELAASGVDPGMYSSPNYVKAKGVLEDIDCFDASFFGYIPSEVAVMDPQTRIFHECVWEALENAGYNPAVYQGLIGLFAGASAHLKWEALSVGSGRSEILGWFPSFQLFDKDFMATHISYNLDLKGPSFVLYTACSTSLAAVHLACQSLLSGECGITLAGGISIIIPNKEGYFYQSDMIMSADGHCRTFDNRASGTLAGEGAGVVVLKSLEEALRDRDFIHAVIKGTAINNDGSGKVGFTAPGVRGQVGVIRAALRAAEIPPESIGYIETHGTGTKLGDPTEIEALTQAFRTDKKKFCALGSLKTNMGHLDSAAGIASLIKTILVLKHQIIPPCIHFEKHNDRIDLENSPFYVNTQLKKWQHHTYPLRAGVSSFGIGGTNVHVILEEAPAETRDLEGTRGLAPLPDTGASREHQLIVLSAKTPSALDKMTDNLARFLKNNPGIKLTDAAYTLQVGRGSFKYRQVFLCASMEEAVASLEGKENRRTGVIETHNPPLVFMFPGQGSQYINMGLGLYREEPVFREALDHCFEILKSIMEYDIKEILYPLNRSNRSHMSYKSHKSYITRTEIAQPLLFAFEYALSSLLKKWGLTPEAMIGHSIGEYTAALLAGVFSLEDALKVVVLRGKLMEQMPGGAMLSVSLSREELTPFLTSQPEIAVAAVNAPSLCVLSGPHHAVDILETHLKREGHRCTRLHTSHAFHSPMMDPVRDRFQEELGRVTLNKPQIPFISNVTGQWITVFQAADPDYWARHLRVPVQFGKGLMKLAEDENFLFLEVGPGSTLTTFARRCGDRTPHSIAHRAINLVRHPKETIPDTQFLLDKIGECWLKGVTVDWASFHADKERYRLPLPTYPFERTRYPIEGNPYRLKQGFTAAPVVAPVEKEWEKKKGIHQWFYTPTWLRTGIGRIPTAPPAADKEKTAGGCIIYMDDRGLGEQLLTRLKQQEQEVIAVEKGTTFASLNHGQYCIDPLQPDDYILLFKEITRNRELPVLHIYLWNIDETGGISLASTKGDAATIPGFYGLLYIVRALGQLIPGSPVHLAVVSDRMHDITGKEITYPRSALLLGAMKVIPQEYPNIKCRSIDLDLSANKPPVKPVAQLLTEINCHPFENQGMSIIALRGPYRWEQTFTPVRLEPPQNGIPRLKEKGIYLVTGGLGGIGLELAGHLARSITNARIIFTGRSEFPQKKDWNRCLDDYGEEHPLSQKINSLQEMEKSGAEVMIFQADVTEFQRMKDVETIVTGKWGKINGIIHAAGVADYGGIIQQRTPEDTEPVLAAKVTGTIVLDELFKEKPLDFFILCSSLSSVLGAAGQVAYCAANAFLDAFAHHKTAKDGTFTASINWDSWQEVGMALEAFKRREGIRDINHPLFLYCIREGNREIYISRFSDKKPWMLNEHRLVGKATLPGTGCLEMARAAFEDHAGPGIIQIYDTYFLIPLVLEPGEEREVHTILEKKDNSKNYDFVIRSLVQAENRQWQEHARGSIGFVRGVPRQIPGDIRQLQNRCSQRVVSLEEHRHREETQLKDFGPRWHNVKTTRFGTGQGLAILELDKAFDRDHLYYKLHPALLDTAVGFPLAQFIGDYLPFSYKTLTIYRALPRRVYCNMRSKGSENKDRDMIKFDFTLMDETGVVLVEIEEYILRMVSAEARERVESQISASLHSSGPEPGQLIQSKLQGEYILSREGIDVFNRVMGSAFPQVVCSTRDLYARLEGIWKSRVETKPGESTVEQGDIKSHLLYPRPHIGTPYAPPTNKLEQELARMWQEFLGIEKVGIHDDFFQLGGDSLKAITFVARLHKELEVKLPVSEMFTSNTVKKLADFIAHTQKQTHQGIRPIEKREYYPQSAAQRRLFFLHRFMEISTSYNMASAFTVEGPLDKNRLEKSFQQLILRHETLRTSFHTIEDKPMQKIHDKVEFEIEYKEVETPDKVEEKQFSVNNFIRPFDMSAAPLMRISIVEFTNRHYLLLFDMHHIILDGTSMSLLIEQLVQLYAGKTLPPLRIQYKDFTVWQNNQFKSDKIKKQLDYWMSLYSDSVKLPRLNLPTDYPRPEVQSFTGDTYRFEVSGSREFSELAQQHDSTLYMNLIAVFNVLLYKYTGQEDIIIGSGIAGRTHTDLGELIGMFVNTLALRSHPVGEKTYLEFLKEIKDTSIGAFENQDIQFEDLVDRLNLERDLSHNPLFDVLLVLQNFDLPEIRLEDLTFVPYYFRKKTAIFDMTLFIVKEEEALIIDIEYCTRLFKRRTIRGMAQHFTTIIRQVINAPNIKISDIDILTREEKQQLLVDFNHTARPYPGEKTIHELFENQVQSNPDHTSLVGNKEEGWKGRRVEGNKEEMQLSYKELNNKSHELALLLIKKGVKADTIVGIMLERSVEMIIGILGILKAGGAYLAIDPDCPRERITYIVRESSAEIIVTAPGLAEKLSMVNCQLLMVNEKSPYRRRLNNPPKETNSINNYQLTINNLQLKGNNLAYILYTSGTSGWPKGVMVEQQNVVRLVKNTDYIRFYPGQKVLQTGPLQFDASTFEIWGPLLNGGILYEIPQQELLIPQTLERRIKRFGIDTIWMTAPLFNRMVDAGIKIFAGLKDLLVGGDTLSPSHINRIKQQYPQLNVINGYGPTENTTFSTTFRINKKYKKNIPIGKPITNSTVYILDRKFNLQPMGVVGELVVGGDGVSRGYLNDPQLTSEKFLPVSSWYYRSYMPYRSYISKKLYKTGDLARWLHDGNIEFLGRADQQVKIRGFRIELKEIEIRLLRYKNIKEAVVTASKDKQGEKYLCAYIIPKRKMQAAKLRALLAKDLPDYMIPSYFISLEKIPLTPSGKIDRKRLPDPELKGIEVYTAPRTSVEKKLAEIWAEVLGIEKDIIGIDHNFFELGGHSLRAIIMVTKVQKELNVKLPLAEIFKTPSIRDLGQYIKTSQPDIYEDIKAVEKREYYNVSHGQKRLWILNRFKEELAAYNMPQNCILKGKLNNEALYKAFTALVEHHETLRTTFIRMRGEPKQKIHDTKSYRINIEYIDLRKEENPETSARQSAREEAQSAFDLGKGPLLRAKLLHIHEDKYLFLFTMHHIISDGWSANVLLHQLLTLYNACQNNKPNPLEPLSIQYKDYAAWHNKQLSGKRLKKLQEYWLGCFKGEVPLLELPTDYTRPPVKTFNGSSLSFEFNKEISNRLNTLAQTYETSLFMTLLAAVNVLFYWYTGQQDIVIGTPTAGREHMDLENQIGFYLNILPLRTTFSGDDSFESLLARVKTITLNAYEHRLYPFNLLVGESNAEPDASRSPLFDVVVQVLNFNLNIGHYNQLKLQEITVEPYEIETTESKFDLTFNFWELPAETGAISAILIYNSDLFKHETVIRMVNRFQELMQMILNNPTVSLSDLCVENNIKIPTIKPISRRKPNPLIPG